MKKELELYIHIPFCKRKCAYCDFLSFVQTEERIEQYTKALIQEILSYSVLFSEYKVTTVFLGGGTPSILTGSQVQRLFEAIRSSFDISEDAEISMEANPGTLTEEKLCSYRNAGVNRMSIGLQSAEQEELELLGRIHTWDAFLQGYQMARNAGFDNINIDLISAIPRQTVKSWENTLKKVITLKPEHISAYSLIIEEGTSFAEKYGEGKEAEQELPSEEEEREMYHKTKEILQDAGYYRYEISNYAKKGNVCRHNLGYWERKEYLGIGLGASSFIDGRRYAHTDDLEFYIQHAEQPELLKRDEEVLSEQEQMEETIFLGLRKMEGISEKEFAQSFGKTIEECYGEKLTKLKCQKLLLSEGGRLKLTERGIDISNYVFAEIIS